MKKPSSSQYHVQSNSNFSIIMPADHTKAFLSFGGGNTVIVGTAEDDHFYFDARNQKNGTYFVDGRTYKTASDKNGAIHTVNDFDTLHITQSRDAFDEASINGLYRLTLKENPSVVLLTVSVEMIEWGAQPMTDVA